jgi:hypothetical protein
VFAKNIDLSCSKTINLPKDISFEDFKSLYGVLFGTTALSFIVRILIASLSLYTGSATSIGDAVGLALDKDRSIAAAVVLINETPKAEIIEAVKE